MKSFTALDHAEFQTALLGVYDQVKRAGNAHYDAALASMRSYRQVLRPNTPPVFFQTFQRFLKLIALNFDHEQRNSFLNSLQSAPDGGDDGGRGCYDGRTEILGELPPLRAEGVNGISLVTCCMNRGGNLSEALQSWLAQKKIAEIIIVDWSSREPVVDLLHAKGISDPRIHVVRVDNEPRWVLSYAFNVGFRAATRDVILKADADIVIGPDFFENNVLKGNDYIAGNWQLASKDQIFVNGFFFVAKGDLQKIGGFNEFITTYGWDDDDLYHRLSSSGLTRKNVANLTISHLDHADADRIADTSHASAVSPDLNQVLSSTGFSIARNRFLAGMMPEWTASSTGMGYNVLEATERFTRLVRQSRLPRMVSEFIGEAATLAALRDAASHRIGVAAHRIEAQTLKLLLSRPWDEISKIDVAVALSGKSEALQRRGRYAVISIPTGLFEAKSRDFSRAIEALISASTEDDRRIVIRSACKVLPDSAPAVLRSFPLIHEHDEVGSVLVMSGTAFLGKTYRQQQQNLLIQLDAQEIIAISKRRGVGPSIITKKRKVFIDAQHGLGNRLRAIGSAAAIAEATERDLVLVWQRDHHCDCEFADLFDYGGPVISERFVAATDELGMDAFNYMPNERGAQKDAEIILNPFRDVYLRSAFTLKHSASNWETENSFLRKLSMTDAVRALTAKVPPNYKLAVHIRMEGASGQILNSYDDESNWGKEDHRLIQYWRSNSNEDRFASRIDNILGQSGAFFLAADMVSIYDKFERKYGKNVIFLRRELYDRSREQIQYALADAVLLGKADRMLASNWSSFSELAMRLSPHEPKIEYCGVDF